MTERAEWEVVDEPSPSRPPTIQELMQQLLGRWWRWKIGGLAAVAVLAVVLLATVVGVALVLMVTVGILSIAVGKFVRWLRSSNGSIVTKEPDRR